MAINRREDRRLEKVFQLLLCTSFLQYSVAKFSIAQIFLKSKHFKEILRLDSMTFIT